MSHPPRILMLTDQRPGHFHQSEAVIEATERLFGEKPECRRVDVRNPKSQKLARHVLAMSGSLGLTRLFSSPPPVPAEFKPALIVSTGGDTLAANATLARHYACENVFIGSLRGVSPHLFTAILHIDPSLADRPNHWIGLKPAPIDPDRPFDPTGLPARYGVLLLGGPTEAEPFDKASISQMFAALTDYCASAGLEALLVFTSRRTPANWERMADALSEALQLHAATDTPFAMLRNALLGAEMVAVSADSSSMVTEAVYARRKTVVLSSAGSRRSDSDRRYLGMLEEQGVIRVLSDQTLDATTISGALASVTPLTVNPLDALGEALVQLGAIDKP